MFVVDSKFEINNNWKIYSNCMLICLAVYWYDSRCLYVRDVHDISVWSWFNHDTICKIFGAQFDKCSSSNGLYEGIYCDLTDDIKQKLEHYFLMQGYT